MKPTFLFLAMFSVILSAQAQDLSGRSSGSALRLALLQKPPAGQDLSRQLSAEERAVLRRQLGEFSKSAGKAP